MRGRARRTYTSKQRDDAAAITRTRVLKAARVLFSRRGIDAVTIAQVAGKAGVSSSTVYALFRSKEGVLRALMEGTLFGGRYQMAVSRLDGITDPVRQIAMTAGIARAIYESESAELGLIRGASAFSPALRRLEQTFEETRLARQAERIEHLYEQGKAKKGLAVAMARRLFWMYTSRDIYRMLVHDGGWLPEQYEAWLSQTLIETLVER